MKKTTIVGVFALLIIVICLSCCTRIDAGHEGILIKQYGSEKGVQDVTLVTGRVWYNPITEDVEEYATFIQTIDYDAFNVNAKDGSEFIVDPTLSYNIVIGNSPNIFRKYRKDLDNREKFETDVQKSLSGVLEAEGFKLEQLTSGLKYPQTIVDAVNAKNKSVQDAMKVENELRINEAQAKKRIVDAKAYADALIIQAEGEAQANKLKQQTLTPMLIQQQFIEKWDGRTPLYGTAPTMFKNVN